MSDVQMSVLEIVGKSREKGVLQKTLSEQTKIDPRNLFHHIKKLESYNLMYRWSMFGFVQFAIFLWPHTSERVEVTATDSKKKVTNTKLVLLARFARNYGNNDEDGDGTIQIPAHAMREVCRLLKNAKDNILFPSKKKMLWLDIHILSEDDLVATLSFQGLEHKRRKRWKKLRERLEEGEYHENI